MSVPVQHFGSEKIKVELIAHSNGIHVQQVYTGLKMLEQSGRLSCRVIYDRERISRNARLGFRSAHSRCVTVKVDDTIICYDLNDNPYLTEEFLETSDFYFKRSYDAEVISRYGELQNRVFPYGFNYLVYTDGTDWEGIMRTFKTTPLRSIPSVAMNYLPVLDLVNYVPRVGKMQSGPDFSLEPKVLFLARLWDPYDSATRSESFVQDRISLNESRIDCIRQLKRNFGARFFGGIIDTPFARKMCPELLVSDRSITSQSGYIRLMQSFPVCISTAGLYRSNGYKLAEYIAFSKAIVSEPVHYKTPGNFQANHNYLEFTSAAECINQVGVLFDDKSKRYDMMVKNWEYYETYMAPDTLIRNTLELALSRASS